MFCGLLFQSFLPISLGGTFTWIRATQFVSGAFLPSEIVDCPAIHLAGFPLNGGKSRVTGRLRVTVLVGGGGEAGISWTIRNTARPHFFLAATREINNHNEETELFAAGRAARGKSVVICTARMTF